MGVALFFTTLPALASRMGWIYSLNRLLPDLLVTAGESNSIVYALRTLSYPH